MSATILPFNQIMLEDLVAQGGLRIAIYILSSISLSHTLSHSLPALGREHEAWDNLSSLLVTSAWLFVACTVLACWALSEFIHGRMNESTALLTLYLCWIMNITAQGNVIISIEEPEESDLPPMPPSRRQELLESERDEMEYRTKWTLVLFFTSMSSTGILGLALFYGMTSFTSSTLSNLAVEQVKKSASGIVSASPTTRSWFFGVRYLLSNPLIRNVWMLIHIIASVPLLNAGLSAMTIYSAIPLVSLISIVSPAMLPIPIPRRTRQRIEQTEKFQIGAKRRAIRCYAGMLHAIIVVFLLIMTTEQTALLNPTAVTLLNKSHSSYLWGC